MYINVLVVYVYLIIMIKCRCRIDRMRYIDDRFFFFEIYNK